MSTSFRDEPVFFVRIKPPAVSVGGGGAVLSPLVNAKAQLAKVQAILARVLASGAGAPSFIADVRAQVATFQARVTELQNIDKSIASAQANVTLGIGVYTPEAKAEADKKLAGLKDDKKRIAASNVPPPPPPPPPPAPRDISTSVLGIEFEEGEKKIDVCKISIENNDLRWFDEHIFEKGTTLIVSWGYAGRMAPPREVVVQKVTGSLALQIEAQGKDTLMNKVHKTRTFTNMSRADVVRQIAEENGYGDEAQDIDTGSAVPSVGVVDSATSAGAALAVAQANLAKARAILKRVFEGGNAAESFLNDVKAQVASLEAAVKVRQQEAAAASAAKAKANLVPPGAKSDVVVYPTITQAGITDAQLLKRLADLQGFEFYCDFDGLHWHPRRMEQKPTVAWTYFLPTANQQGDIISFNLENDVTAKPGEVKVTVRDPLTKTETTVTANNASTPRPTTAPTPELFAPVDEQTGVVGATRPKPAGATSVEVRPTSETTAAGAKTEAQGVFKRTQQATVKLTLDVVGNPNVVAKTVVLLNGLGKRLSGRYYIAEVTHKLTPGSGYTMTVKCRTDGTNQVSATGTKSTAEDKSAAQPNTKAPPDQSDIGKLTPLQTVDKASGETKTIYVDTRGRDRGSSATGS